MEHPSNLREALLAETLGDLHKLLNRADKLVPAIDEARKAVDDARKALDESRKAMVTTARGMTAEGEVVKRQVLAEAEDTKKAALRYLGDNTKQLLAEIALRQARAMSDTAQSLVEKEVGSKLRDLAAELAKQADRANDPWRDWLAHACTGALSSICAAWVLLLFVYPSDPSRPTRSEGESPQALPAAPPDAKASTTVPLAGRREKGRPSRGSQSR